MITSSNTTSFEELTSKEWLVTNGLGGYASSSIVGANTRRYHGLLVAALNPPTGRMVLVSKVEESILLHREHSIGLSSNRYPGTVFPEGFRYFKFFERKPLPRTKFEVSDCHLLKTVFMPQGSNTTVVEYENTGTNAYQLRLRPQFVHRDYHSFFREDYTFDYWMQRHKGHFTVYAHYGAPPLHVAFSRGKFVEDRQWYKNVEYDREQERGFDHQEDCFALGHIECTLRPGERVSLTFSTDEAMMAADPEQLLDAEIERLAALPGADSDDAFFRDLALAADQFIVRRASTESHSVIAGYHWFTDWGRDTMIAMRGLTIALGRHEETRGIVRSFLHHLDQGMLPNRFPDRPEDEVEYNTLDATLWLFVVLYEHYQKTYDLDFVAEVFPRLIEILDFQIKGTRYNIHATEEGFLWGGEGLSQLTWMDARIGDHVVTPRQGCPVEIQALWYNALRISQHFSGLLEANGKQQIANSKKQGANGKKPTANGQQPTAQSFEAYKAVADKLEQNFRDHFWHPGGYLYDVVVPHKEKDAAIRPNQIYVVSLPFALLSHEEECRVVETVRRHLLTGFGLRSLSPDSPDFRPMYAGGPAERDSAYHQGTVWPFLLGEYATAWLKTQRWSAKSVQEVKGLLEPLRQHFYQHDGLLGISEIFDGGLPSGGKGCIQQAWSVGALLKTLADLKNQEKKLTQAKPQVPQFLEAMRGFIF